MSRVRRDCLLRQVCLDLAVTLEGRKEDELPERILAAYRCDHVNFKGHTSLPRRPP